MRETESIFETLELVTRQMGVAVARCSRDFRCLWANQEYANWIQRPLDEIIGRPIADVLGREAFESRRSYFERVLRGERVQCEQETHFSGIGKRWTSATYTPTLEADGVVSGWVAVVIDITERKRAEEALRNSEERFRLAAQAGKMFAYEWDAATDKLVRSGDCSQVLGVKESAPLTGEQVFAKVHPEDREKLTSAIAKLSPQKPYLQISYRMLRPDDAIIWVERNSQAYFDDNGVLLRIAGMVADITERKRIEEALRESETRFRLAANSAPAMIWMSGLDKKPTYFNQRWLDFTGLSEGELQNGLAGIVHPEDYEQCHEVYCRGFDQRQPFRKECRLRSRDGQYRWMLDIGVPRFHDDGSFVGYIGSCVDVTDQKLAEQALANTGRKLIEAHEEERRRIARELHDDIGQRLALLAIELDRLRQRAEEPVIVNQATELLNQATCLTSDVDNMSHTLHSSKIEMLGLVAAMQSASAEFGKHHKMEIDFESQDVHARLPAQISIGLFRVLQEALRNASKHSGVKHVEVRLRENAGEIHLMVSDLGRGFDVEAVERGKGLGLTSMRERVRLVNGTISIESKPMHGTAIHVCVPLESEHNFHRAAAADFSV
jgi:PAS domain S-box-containing protein